MQNNQTMVVQKQLEPLYVFVSEQLPSMNREAERDPTTVHNVISTIGAHLSFEFNELMNDGGDATAQAREALAILEPCVASMERHAQGQGATSGKTLGAIPGLTEYLLKLGQQGKHPPRGSHDTAIKLASRTSPLTSSGLPGEVYFWGTVAKSERYMLHTVALLNQVRTGTLDLEEPWVVNELEQSAIFLEDLHNYFRGFRTAETKGGEPRLGRFEFALLRQYLLPIKIGREQVNGPNPAHVGSWPRLDLAMGMHDRDYLSVLRERYDSMLPEDTEAIEIEAGLPSVAKCLDDLLRDRVSNSWRFQEPGKLARLLWTDERSIGEFVHVFGRLAKAAKVLTSVHWALVQNYVVRATAAFSEEERKALPISGGTGVSNRPVQDTLDLRDIRCSQEVVEALIVLSQECSAVDRNFGNIH